MKIWKPTQVECDLIKRAAAREGGLALKRVLLEPGVRYNTEQDREPHMNIALVSDDPDWNDTDLSDYGAWDYFRKGVPLTEDGRAVLDFYIRARFTQPDEDDLWGNITVYYQDGRITRIHGYPGEYPIT